MNEDKIKKIFRKLDPFIKLDGGLVEFIAFKNNIVFVKLGGNCVDCSLADNKLLSGILTALQKEVPEVSNIKVLNDFY